MAIRDPERLNARAALLGDKGLNGLDFLLVDSLDTSASPEKAHLEVHFHTPHGLDEILALPEPTKAFPIYGGQRLRAGPTGEVAVRAIARPSAKVFDLTISTIGDYSSYTLEVDSPAFDPLFSEIPFKFRPGCFSTLCDPEWERPSPTRREPSIDYLAKDFDSFRHVLMSAIEERVPGWKPSSEVDLGQVLISLFSASADELSDHQDRVLNEAYLASARNRISLARHARLMDYHIHQGNQAETWLAVRLKSQAGAANQQAVSGLRVWTGDPGPDQDSAVFVTRSEVVMNELLNDMELYDWGGAQYALEAGATSAELRLTPQRGGATLGDADREQDAKAVEALIREGKVRYLLVQEHLDPVTGRAVGYDPPKRQLLTLSSGQASGSQPAGDAPRALRDPVTGEWFVRVYWEEPLENGFCFTRLFEAENRTVPKVSLFHGNLIPIYQGDVRRVVFRHPGMRLEEDPASPFPLTERHYEVTAWGTICRLPRHQPLLYRDTPPRSAEEPQSTLEARPPEEWHENPEADPDAADEAAAVDAERPRGHVLVRTTEGAADVAKVWDEVISLVGSDEDEADFVVETDERGRSRIRFGDGRNGAELPEGAVVECWYQTGLGPAGNVGADCLTNFAPVNPQEGSTGEIESVWNPFDATNGRAPEPRAEVLRSVPEAFRTRQHRAVSLDDYARRAEEVAGVSRATARYGWAGSWRTVRVTIDPQGSEVLSPHLRRRVARHLEVVRLIGDDLEIRGPRLVPLEITVELCVCAEVWPRDVRAELEMEFSDGYTADGRLGFFHPDRWTFGQPLRESQILGRIRRVSGVDHVRSIVMGRRDGTGVETAIVRMRPSEVIQVRNDPDHMERGSIAFDLLGGRR